MKQKTSIHCYMYTRILHKTQLSCNGVTRPLGHHRLLVQNALALHDADQMPDAILIRNFNFKPSYNVQKYYHKLMSLPSLLLQPPLIAGCCSAVINWHSATIMQLPRFDQPLLGIG